MPKLKPTASDKAADILRRNIAAVGAVNDCYTDAKISKRIGMDRSTYCYRKKHPKAWTFFDLIRLSEAFKVSIAWLVTDHSSEMKGE